MKILQEPTFAKHFATNTFSVSYSGFVKTDCTWKSAPIRAPFSRLYFITEGSGMLVSDTEKMPLEPGYVYLAPCGSVCGFFGTDSVTKLFFHIHVITPEGQDILEGLRRFLRLPMEIGKIEEMRQHYLSKELADHMRLTGMLYDTLSEFLTLAPELTGPGRLLPSDLTAALTYISGHLSAGLTIREVAAAAFCSESRLTRLFRQEMKTSFSHHVEQLVMAKAQTFLLYSDLPIREISTRLGFCDQFYFSRRFRKTFSTSPSHYRRERSDLAKG